MRMFDVINPNPTVEYVIDSKKDDNKQYQTVYCPKVKVTFYMDQDSTVALLNILAPLLFCAIGNTMNTVYLRGTEDYPDFLANSLALGLTVVFLIPSISSTESLKNEMNSNTFLSLTLFLGLIFGLFSAGLSEKDVEAPWRLQSKYYLSIVSNIFMYGALLIMGYNAKQYWQLRAKIHAWPPHEESPTTFCGRPNTDGHNKKGSEVDLGHIEPFWDLSDEDEKGKKIIKVNPLVIHGLDDPTGHGQHNLWRVDGKPGKVKAVYAGVRKEELLEHMKFFNRKKRNAAKKTAPNGSAESPPVEKSTAR